MRLDNLGSMVVRGAMRWGTTALAARLLMAPVLTGAETVPWFTRALVGIEVGPTGAQFGHSDTNDARYCARFDGREIVRCCAAAHGEYAVVWARDGDYAYYNSKLLLKPPGLGARDPLREAVDAGGELRLPVIAYCVVQQGGHYLAAHPEFEMRGPDGRRIGRFCYNSGYLGAMKMIVDEQIAYGIDGFHIDMLDQGFGPPYGCWCHACRQQFTAEHGRPMPPGVAWDADWDRMLAFRYASSDRFERALRDHIRSRNPRLSVDFNYHGNPPFSWEVGQLPVQHADNADFVTGETGLWGFSALTVGLNAQFYRAATPGCPVQVAISRDARVYHNQTVRPLADLRWELFTLLAHGAFVTVVDKTAFDGSLDPLAYQRIGQAFTDARERRENFGQATVAEVGLYFSSRTRDWWAREKPAEYFQSFLGAHKALVYEHIPWGVILDESLTLDALKRFPIVLLANVAILTAAEADLLTRYVNEGGRLIVTGLAGGCDAFGKWVEQSPIQTLIGARLVGRLDSLDNWVRFPGAPGEPIATRFASAGPAGRPFLVKGPAVRYEPTTATATGELMKPYRTVRQQQGNEGTEWPMSAEAVVGPAVLLNRVGRGAVLTFAGSPDFATAGEHHIAEARHLLSAAVRKLHPAPRLRISAPVTIEAVVTDDPVRRVLRVHLIGYNAPPQTMPARERPYVLPGLIEDAPLYRATVELDRPIRRARAWNKSTVVRRRVAQVEVTVNDIHEVLALAY